MRLIPQKEGEITLSLRSSWAASKKSKHWPRGRPPTGKHQEKKSLQLQQGLRCLRRTENRSGLRNWEKRTTGDYQSPWTDWNQSWKKGSVLKIQKRQGETGLFLFFSVCGFLHWIHLKKKVNRSVLKLWLAQLHATSNFQEAWLC